MTTQRRPGMHPVELRERAVRLVREGEAAYGSAWGAICAVAEMLGPTAETVRK
jgi:transposase-like protein